MDLFIYLFAALFSVLNPIGTVPIFVGLTQHDSQKERSRISLWTAINVGIILLVSYFIGQYVLTFFGISIDALRIAGGIVIVNSGFSLLSGKFNKKRGINKKIENEAQQRNDIALTPLAIPMLSRSWINVIANSFLSRTSSNGRDHCFMSCNFSNCCSYFCYSKKRTLSRSEYLEPQELLRFQELLVLL